MRQGFRDANFDRLAEFWNRFAPEKYHIDGALMRINTVECPVFDWGASRVLEGDGEILGFVVVKKSAASLYKGPDKDVAHLCVLAYCDPSFGVDLMADVKQTLRNRGVARLVFGQDIGHFFPGCPDDFSALSDFLMVEGFVSGGEAVDLERDMTGYRNTLPVPEDGEYRPVEKKDIGRLVSFLDREFPGRWRYDVMRKLDSEGPRCVFGLFRDDHCDGFALLQDWRDQLPIGGAAWRVSLGENWGSLGPIGVSANLRGRGYGHALLGEALANLRDRGVKRAIIDWTGLRDFYGKHGFEVTRTYKSMSLALGE
jgi:GNAT superfamily N-acetyltransferase